LSLHDDKAPPPPPPPHGKTTKKPSRDVGNALRSAYQRMIDEDIPPEMLDLLGKLG
jgi:hypothetical protein